MRILLHAIFLVLYILMELVLNKHSIALGAIPTALLFFLFIFALPEGVYKFVYASPGDKKANKQSKNNKTSFGSFEISRGLVYSLFFLLYVVIRIVVAFYKAPLNIIHELVLIGLTVLIPSELFYQIASFKPLDEQSQPKNKLISIFKSKNFLLGAAAFLLPALMLYVVFIINGVHPFGTKQVLVTDLWHQYYPFLCTLQEKLQAGESLLYSETIGMGVNFWGLIAYYCASPLNFLVALVSKESLRDLVAILIVLKVGFSGLFFSRYLKKVHDRYEVSTIIFSSIYALCGYMLGYYWNIMWLDCMALLPLVMLGVYSIVKENKCKLYIISLAVAVISNFYIGFMLCIFTALYFFAECVKQSVKFKAFFKKLGLIIISSVVALALTAFMTIPAYNALGETVSSEPKAASAQESDKSALEKLGDDFGAAFKEFTKDAPGIASRFMSFNEPVPKDGLPNAFSGFISIILLGYFICSKKISGREKAATLSLIVIMFMSMTLKGIDLIWHGMHTPNMVPYRYAFIVSFVFIAMAYRTYLAELDCEYEPMKEKNRIPFATSLIISGIVIACGFNKKFINSLGGFLSDGKAIKETIVATVIGCIALTIVYYVVIESIRGEKNPLMRKRWAAGLCGVVLAEVVINTIIAVPTVRTTDHTTYYWRGEEIEQLLETVDADSSYGRVETSQEYILNDPALYGYKGVSTFTSTANVNISKFMEKLAICGLPRSNRYYYETTSPLTNGFLGVERVIFKNNMKNLNPYLQEEAYTYHYDDKRLMVFENIKTKLDENEALKNKYPAIYSAAEDYIENNSSTKSKQVIYNNTEALPIGFMAESTILEEGVLTGRNAFDIQNNLFTKSTGIEEDIFTMIPLVDGEDFNYHTEGNVKVSGYAESGDFTIKNPDNVKEPEIKFFIEAQNDKPMYVYIKGNKFTNVKVDGTTYKIGARAYIMPIGRYQAGDEVELKFKFESSYKDSAPLKLLVYTLDEEVFEKGMQMLRDEPLVITKYESTLIEGTIDVAGDGVLYTSIPYEKGWTMYVDGNKTPITPLENAMICVNLTTGEHNIKLVYSPAGFGMGVKISLAAFAVFVIGVIITWRRKKLGQNINSSTLL